MAVLFSLRSFSLFFFENHSSLSSTHATFRLFTLLTFVRTRSKPSWFCGDRTAKCLSVPEASFKCLDVMIGPRWFEC